MKLTPLFALIAATSVLSACGSGDSDVIGSCSTCNPPASGDPVSVITISGNTLTLDGTISTGCYESGGGSVEETLTISASNFTKTGSEYTSFDCSGAVVASAPGNGTYTFSGTLAAGTTTAITGWVFGNGTPVMGSPGAEDSSGSIGLADYTLLTATIPGLGSTTLFFVVDDTGTGMKFYRDYDASAGETTAQITDAFFSSDFVATPK